MIFKRMKIFNFFRHHYPLTGDFDFHHKRKPTVPMYADGLCLLVFGAFLTARLLS